MLPRSASVTHFGPYPPIYGGVSVHIRRLHLRLLRLEWNSSVISPPDLPAFPDKGVTAARKFRHRSHWLRYPGVPVLSRIVHCHECWMRMSWVLLRLRLQGCRIVITVHDQQDARRWSTVGVDRRLGARILDRLPGVRWIAVSQTVREQLVARGVADRQIEVIPAFLAPIPEEADNSPLPQSVLDFLSAHDPVLSIYGSKYDFVNGVDLYGFDMAIEAVAALKPAWQRLGLLVCVPGNLQTDYQTELSRRARQLSCMEDILFMNEGVADGSELWRRSRVHLRPTTTDGDSIAVREALSLGVPVVASDAAPRPAGCLEFTSRNQQSFVRAVQRALSSSRPTCGNGDPASEVHLNAIVRQYQQALPSCAD